MNNIPVSTKCYTFNNVQLLNYLNDYYLNIRFNFNKMNFEAIGVFEKVREYWEYCESDRKFREDSLEEFLCLVFEDILSRIEINTEKDMITRTSFCVFLDFPLLICERIFAAFIAKEKRFHMSREEFVDGMKELFFPIDEIKFYKRIFRIFDFQGEGKILADDILLLLNYLNSYMKKISISKSQSLMVNNLKYSLDFETFLFGVKSNSESESESDSELSKIIYYFIFSLLKSLPITEKSLRHFNFIIANSEFNYDHYVNNGVKVNSKEKDDPLSLSLSVNPCNNSLKRKGSNSTVKTSEKDEEEINYLENNPSIQVFKMCPDGRFEQLKLVLVEKILFSYSDTGDDTFLLEKIYSLPGYYVTQCNSVEINDEIFYPFALMNKYGNTNTNYQNIFFCEDKIARDQFVSAVKIVLNIRDFEDDYCIDPEYSLGNGHFGTVLLAYDKFSNEKVAVKIIEKFSQEKYDYDLVLREIHILKFLMINKHENIVTPLNIYENTNFIFIVLEYANEGNLKNFISRSSNNIDPKLVCDISLQLLEGLKFLKKFGIIHRDLKCENILVNSYSDSKFQFKISDFGLSKIVGKIETCNNNCGTLLYSAPEVLKHHNYNYKADIWSFGVILYYLFTGAYPFDGKNISKTKLAEKICTSKLKFPKKSKFDSKMINLIEKMMRKNPKERIDLPEISSILSIFYP